MKPQSWYDPIWASQERKIFFSVLNYIYQVFLLPSAQNLNCFGFAKGANHFYLMRDGKYAVEVGQNEIAGRR
jgi:hypothetical protein